MALGGARPSPARGYRAQRAAPSCKTNLALLSLISSPGPTAAKRSCGSAALRGWSSALGLHFGAAAGLGAAVGGRAGGSTGMGSAAAAAAIGPRGLQGMRRDAGTRAGMLAGCGRNAGCRCTSPGCWKNVGYRSDAGCRHVLVGYRRDALCGHTVLYYRRKVDAGGTQEECRMLEECRVQTHTAGMREECLRDAGCREGCSMQTDEARVQNAMYWDAGRMPERCRVQGGGVGECVGCA